MPVEENAESERRTRKKRIDPCLDSAGWRRRPRSGDHGAARRTEEEPTADGPADYALWADGRVVGVVEAKKLSVSPSGVLTQAERYARGLPAGEFDFGGRRCPFLYSTNGELIRFHDVRHPLNCSREVAAFHTPAALREFLSRDLDAATATLLAMPHDHPRLRPYQHEANAAVERAIADRKRNMLVAMATGTGKTFTMVSQAYRLMKAGVARRVLFLVDRRALAAQAVRAFAAFEAEPGTKFDQSYEVYSSRFQKADFGDDEPFDPKLLPTGYLTDPKPGHAFVYVATIQRMAMQVLGRQAVFGTPEEAPDDDAERLDIPIHAFDLVIADECHRGYTAQEESVWRATLDHFDAIRIGLTATPASHTTTYFENVAFRYDFGQAVRDGHLVDYDVVSIRSDVRLHGVFLREGERVDVVNPTSGAKQLDFLEDERQFDSAEIEQKVTAPDSNQKIVEEVRTYALAHEQATGRLPKTLIFAVNDIPHTSHADQLVDVCRRVYGLGESYVQKITGRVDRPLQRIREFRNRPQPGIAVTVDLLTTGVDIPDLEFLVFLRPIKSRILFEQMLGRGTRKGEQFPDKSHFTVFDCFDGTLLAYFRTATGITEEPPAEPTRTITEIIGDIWSNQDRDYNVRCLAKRLHRIDRTMAPEARDRFAAFVPDGDVAGFARRLPRALGTDFVGTMKLLRDDAFQELLVSYPRPSRHFLVAREAQDTVASTWLVRGADGREYRPEEYLEAFARFVRENPAHIEAIRILRKRPRDWNPAALHELRQKLAAAPLRFTEEQLRSAHRARYQRDLVDIISMVKHAADVEEPLLTSAERVARAVARVTAGRQFSEEEQRWIERIRIHLQENLSVDREDFEHQPVLARSGGWNAAERVLGDRLEQLIRDLNEAVAA